ncbi:hypothetical protein D770_07890 [Flammeovirgaceae bacterium 311]|nr:hypothetical protein D770_07890 [Flammeovirgaceae bacterium 311]
MDMKRIFATFGFLAFILLAANTASAQCGASDMADNCITQMSDGFNFVKSFPIDGDKGARNKIEYSYVFAKGTEYAINICTGSESPDGIIVSLYDSNRRQVTTNQANGKLFKGVVYNCNSTGIYYITFTFKESTEHCGGSVLGFRR